MNGRTCQLCGKPLSRFTVGSGGDFCSREHRNQYRLRLGMDRLMEANKVASLMRRRENAKAIPAAQLASDCKVSPRSSPHFRVPARQPSLRSLTLPAALHPTNMSPASRHVVTMRPAASPARGAPRPLESVDSFTGRQTRPVLPPRSDRFPVQIKPAGVVVLPSSGSTAKNRPHQVASLGRTPARTNVGGNGIQVRALALSASRNCQVAQLARRLMNSADPGRALRVSSGVGFRLPAARIPHFPFAGPRTAPLLNATRARSTTTSCRPTVAGPKPATIQISIRGLFGPTPPAENGAVDFRWPAAIVPGPIGPHNAADSTRTSNIAWVASAPCSPELRLTNGAARFQPSAAPAPFSSSPAPHAIESVRRLTLVRFDPQDTPFEWSPTALHGTLVSGMMFGMPAARKTDTARPAALEEHFDAGLHNWLGGTDDWKLDVAGVRAGSLALFTPSLELADYQLEFLTRIENLSVTWVFRAANFNDYYQVTLATVPGGGYEFRRRAVIGGTAETPIACPVPTTSSVPALRTAVTLRTRVMGNEFTVFLDGQVVDTWTDPRLATGGIGFLGAQDDRARLYWVKVTPAGHLNKEYSKS
jgi:hypothetical protein